MNAGRKTRCPRAGDGEAEGRGRSILYRARGFRAVPAAGIVGRLLPRVVPFGQANRAGPGRLGVQVFGSALRATRSVAVHTRPATEWRRVLDRTKKREFVAALASVFAETSFVVVTRNAGLTVAEATVLRRRMRDAGATIKVTKNRLATLALDGTRFEGIAPLLKGPIALAWSRDPVAVAKTAVEFARTNDRFVVLGGSIGNQTLDAAGVKALSELPSLEALRARLLGLLQAPATRIAGILQAPGGQLARVLAAYAERDAATESGPGDDPGEAPSVAA